MKCLIYGHKGWIGSIFCEYVKENFPYIKLLYPSSRVNDIDGVISDLLVELAVPDFLISTT